jgi:D-alanyl-D-alanine dipeptidase
MQLRYVERFPVIQKVANLHWLDQAGYVILAYLIIFSLSEPAKVVVQTVSVAVETATAPTPTGKLADLFKDDNSPGTLAICAAEGNCDFSGNKQPNYFGHVDPGNDLRNLGSCSAQPYMMKDYDRNGKIDEKDGDIICLRNHQKSLKFQSQKFRGAGLNPEEHVEALVAAVDLYNQASPWVSYQFIEKYAEVIKTGQRGTDAITEARVQSFRKGNNLSAGGLFRVCSNPGNALGQNLPGTFRSESWRHECIRRDQARRQKNIAAVLKANGY